MINGLILKLFSTNTEENISQKQYFSKSKTEESIWSKNKKNSNNSKVSNPEYRPTRNPLFNFTLLCNFDMETIMANKVILSTFTDKEIEELVTESKKSENKERPLFFLCEKIKGANPYSHYSGTVSNTCYESALASPNLSYSEYEKLNEKLYGKKLPKVQKLFDDFKQKYPDIKLMVDNDVSLKKAKEIIKATEEFINYQKKAKAPFAQIIQFTKMIGKGGFFLQENKNKIYVEINYNSSYNYILKAICHENGHLKDYRNLGFIDKQIPEEIGKILKKVLSDYSTRNSRESIAEFISAIETPGDKDDMKMTKKIRVRKNRNGDLVLMIDKKSNITKEEVEKLGEYYRSIICPEIIPDYDNKKHGSIEKYNETIIRDEKRIKEYLAKEFSPSDLENINKRNLFSSEYSQFTLDEIRCLSRTSQDTWQNIKDRELLNLKNMKNNTFNAYDIIDFALLDKRIWKNIEIRELFSKKNKNGEFYSKNEIITLAKYDEKTCQKVMDRQLFSITKIPGRYFNDEDIKKLAQFDEDIWKNLIDRNLLTLKNSTNRFFEISDIEELAKLSKYEWEIVTDSDRQLLTLKKPSQESLNGKDIVRFAKFSNQEWNNFMKREFYDRDIYDRNFDSWEIKHFVKLDNDEWKKVIDNKLLGRLYMRKKRFSADNIMELAKQDEDIWKNITDRKLLDLQNTKNKYLETHEILKFAKLSDSEWEKIKNSYHVCQ